MKGSDDLDNFVSFQLVHTPFSFTDLFITIFLNKKKKKYLFQKTSGSSDGDLGEPGSDKLYS